MQAAVPLLRVLDGAILGLILSWYTEYTSTPEGLVTAHWRCLGRHYGCYTDISFAVLSYFAGALRIQVVIKQSPTCWRPGEATEGARCRRIEDGREADSAAKATQVQGGLRGEM